MPAVRYQFEYDERIRCAFIGAGGHSFRNVYPALQYAPVDLVAVCDRDADRAATYARMFGAATHYADYHEMLAREQPTAVFVVTSYHPDGRVQATEIAADCLAAGAQVWMEKPTAASSDEVRSLQEAERRTGRFVMTGLKKIFTPAMEKTKQITESPDFGGLSSIAVRYPQDLPPPERRVDGAAMIGFLDHIYHPAAILNYLAGPVDRMSYEWSPTSGATVANLHFASGVIGTLHLAAGAAATSPLERVEVVGKGANVVVDNGVHLTYYRRGASLPYGRSASFVVDDDVAPLRWQPEHSLGQLYNKNLFYLGYVSEILHFCQCVLDDTYPSKGTLADAWEIMRLYDAFRQHPPGVVIPLGERESDG